MQSEVESFALSVENELEIFLALFFTAISSDHLGHQGSFAIANRGSDADKSQQSGNANIRHKRRIPIRSLGLPFSNVLVALVDEGRKVLTIASNHSNCKNHGNVDLEHFDVMRSL